MIYLPNFYNFQIVRILVQRKSPVRKISTQHKAKVEKTVPKKNNKGSDWISTHLTSSRIKEIKSVTGINTGLNYISWVQLSVPKLHLTDWKLKIFPEDFTNHTNEFSILAFAHNIRNSLPNSDLYVMESYSIREARKYVGLNKIQLSAMLAALLNNCSQDLDSKDKVIFQKKFIMNYLYNIQIGSERVSTKYVAENILLRSVYSNDDCDSIDKSWSNYPKITVNSEFIENFKQSDVEMQENLSLALLLTLSFIDVNLFRNGKSLEKIKSRRKKFNS